MNSRIPPFLALALFLPLVVHAGGTPPTLPDPALTPGDARLGVTAKDLCPTAHTATIRNVTSAEKREVYAEYHVAPETGYCSGGCEVDHLISLELGGSNDVKNLWPQPYQGTRWNAHAKDRLEDHLHALVCAGKEDLTTAQRNIARDWIAEYKRHPELPKVE